MKKSNSLILSEESPDILTVEKIIELSRYAVKHAVKPKIVKTARQAKVLNDTDKRIYDILGKKPLVVWKKGMKFYELPMRKMQS
jgi:hypothetical protein